MNTETFRFPLARILKRRLINATRFSFAGLRRAWKEEAFRVELALILILGPTIALLECSRLEKAMLVATLVAVLVVELLNTAVEEAINRIGPEVHPLSAAAKDLGSAAVLMTIAGAAIIWALILWPL